ncbi:MAG: hypothetical protein IJP92_12595 [Lachnospiraceae bacterium]|nr:hypothetical protein [Lachnospiraceae bacterium]
MDETALEQIYQENLEERIIAYLSEQKGLTLEEAMRIYYSSSLAEKIHDGEYGVQYLDFKELTQILCETELHLNTAS